MNNKEAEELYLALQQEIYNLLGLYKGTITKEAILIVKNRLSTLLASKLLEQGSNCAKCLNINVTPKQEDPRAIEVTISREALNICPFCPIR